MAILENPNNLSNDLSKQLHRMDALFSGKWTQEVCYQWKTPIRQRFFFWINAMLRCNLLLIVSKSHIRFHTTI